jgi:hypothetical protein
MQHQLVTLPVEMLEKIFGLVRPRRVAESTIPLMEELHTDSIDGRLPPYRSGHVMG